MMVSPVGQGTNRSLTNGRAPVARSDSRSPMRARCPDIIPSTLFPSGRPLYERSLPDGKYIIRKGGIWLPKGGDGKPRLFIAFEPETVTVDAGTLTAISTSSSNAARVSGSTIVSQSVGGAIGGAITDAFAEKDRGKFMVLVPYGDPDFDDKLLVYIAKKSVAE
jgi:hypothetical protein